MIRCENISFRYPDFGLDIPELIIQSGSVNILAGPSGSGKSTLLQLLAGILLPAHGHIMHDDIDLSGLNERERCDFRMIRLGLVFQEFALLEYLSVLDNVILPYRMSGIHELNQEAVQAASQLLSWVGLEKKKDSYPSQISQGERQRVAICRALVTKPEVLLFDEPTSNLDRKNRDKILEVLEQYSQLKPHTLVMVTHDQELYDRADQIFDVTNFQTSAI